MAKRKSSSDLEKNPKKACNEVTANTGRMITRSLARQVTNSTATIQSSISKSAALITNIDLEKKQNNLAELLGAEITIDSIVLIENLVKECQAVEQNTQTTSYSNDLYALLFTYLAENTANLSRELMVKLLSILSLIKVENLSIETTNLVLELFVRNLVRTSFFNDALSDFILSIGNMATNINLMLETALKECQFGELNIIKLADFFLAIGKNSLSKENILLMVTKLFEKTLLKPKQLVEIVTLAFRLTKLIGDENRAIIYENVLKIFLDIDFLHKDYVTNKILYSLAEKEALSKFKEEFKSLKDPFNISSRDSIYFDYAIKIKKSFAAYSIGKIMNRAFFAFNLISLNYSEETALMPLCDQLISVIFKYFEAIAFKKSNKWSDKSFKENCSLSAINSVVKYHNLIVVLNEDDLVNGLVKLTTRLLSRIALTKEGEKNDLANKINSFIIQFVSNILNDLVKYCEKAKSIILDTYLTKSIENSTHSHLFISQIDSVFNSASMRQFYFSKSTKEKRAFLLKIIINKLTNNYCAIDYNDLNTMSHESIHSFGGHIHNFANCDNKIHNTLFQMKCENALSLLAAVRTFIFTSCNYRIDKDVDTFSDLIEFLTEAMGDKDKNHIAIFGLVSVLTSLSKNSYTKQTSQSNGSIAQLAIDTDFRENLNQMLKDNAKRSSLLLSRLLAHYEILGDDTIFKSHLLQSFYTLVSNDTPLIKEIALFLTNKLKSLTVKDDKINGTYFNLERCLTKSKITEPVDILFDVSILCYSKSLESIKNNSIHEAFGILVGLKTLCKQIAKTYLEKDAGLLFDIYNRRVYTQLEAGRAETLQAMYQLQYGIFDCLIEHLILSQSHNNITNVLKKQEETSTLIRHQIEELVNGEQRRTNTVKRKLHFEGESTTKPVLRESKRFKTLSKSNDKENIVPSKKKSTVTQRPPLANITQRIENIENHLEQVRPSTSHSSMVNNMPHDLTKTLAEHVPIISYKSLLKIVQFCFSSREHVPDRQFLSDNSKSVSLIVDGKFIDYALKVAEKKLKAFTQKNTRSWYDPEMMDEADACKLFAELWFSFTMRITFNTTHISKKIKLNIQTPPATNFNPISVATNNRITHLAQTLWSLMPENKKDQLFISETCIKTEFRQLTWNLLLHLLSNVKHYIAYPSTQVIAFKFCSSILNLIYAIIESVKLTNENYEYCQEWLVDLAKKAGSKEADIAKDIVKLLYAISVKCDSPVSNVKYMALELSVINATPVCTCPSSVNTLYTNQNRNLKYIGLTEQFKFLNQTNASDIHSLTFECLNSWFKSVEWSINNYAYFENVNLVVSMCKQLEITLLALNYLLKSISNFDSSELVLKLTVNFFTLIAHLLKSDLILKLNDSDSLQILKSLIESIYLIFNCKTISPELSRIKDIRIKSKILKREIDLLETCIEKIDFFEKTLVAFSKTSGLIVETKFMAKYKTFISDLELIVPIGASSV